MCEHVFELRIVELPFEYTLQSERCDGGNAGSYNVWVYDLHFSGKNQAKQLFYFIVILIYDFSDIYHQLVLAKAFSLTFTHTQTHTHPFSVAEFANRFFFSLTLTSYILHSQTLSWFTANNPLKICHQIDLNFRLSRVHFCFNNMEIMGSMWAK